VARPAAAIRAVEDGLQPLRELGEARGVGAGLCRGAAQDRTIGVDRRCIQRPSPSGRIRRKRGLQCNALGRSRGGFTTKLHALVDTQSRPLYVTLTPGQQHEATLGEQLVEHASGSAFIADTGYDADRIVAAVRRKGMRPVICCNPTRKRKRRLDRRLYRKRYLVEVFFHNLKRFRAVATRYEKTARNYLALVHLACTWLWTN
jgi:transposase